MCLLFLLFLQLFTLLTPFHVRYYMEFSSLVYRDLKLKLTELNTFFKVRQLVNQEVVRDEI